ncbi:MAG: hypothetical protein WC517_00120 [Patescibacteria group bacterium]
MKNINEQTERIRVSRYELGGGEMLALSESNPQEFLLKYGVEPALEMLEQGRYDYDTIVTKSQRTEEEDKIFIEKWKSVIGYDPDGNPGNLPWVGQIRDRYRQILSPGFCQFIDKDNFSEFGGEVRFYLSIKQDYLLDFLEQLAGAFEELPDLFAFKINISNQERNENAVLYLTEAATRSEIDKLLQVLSGLRVQIHDSQEVFNGFDFQTPFSQPIVEESNRAIIGQLAFNPFASAKGKVKLSYDGREIGRARTVNQLFSKLVELVRYCRPTDSSPEETAQMIAAEAQVTCSFEDGSEEKILSLVQYCQLCLQKLSDICKS